MGLYVEVMCDVRKMGADPDRPLRALCWSDENDNPQGRSVVEARTEARKQGWKIGPRSAAICPGCLNGEDHG